MIAAFRPFFAKTPTNRPSKRKNKEKLAAFDQEINSDDLIDGKYLLVQRGKKNYFLIIVK